MLEPGVIESEIKLRARELIENYGPDFVIELIDVFLQEASGRVARLRKAVESGDRESWIREAHTLKSGCANIGAGALARVAQELEFAGRAGNTSGARSGAEQIETLFAQIKATLEGLRACLADGKARCASA